MAIAEPKGSTARAERKARNAGLAFHGTRYVPVNPFFTMPSWWRRFVFILLKPREFVMYAYICSQTGEAGIAFPTYDNIKADLNISNRSMISKALSELENKGFLLRSRQAPLDGSRHPRNVFQRPSVEYTLWRLLTAEFIDGDLRCLRPRPTAAATRRDKPTRNSGGIRTALHAILGDEAYSQYSGAPSSERSTILAQRLNQIVQAQQLDFANRQAAVYTAAVPDDLLDDTAF